MKYFPFLTWWGQLAMLHLIFLCEKCLCIYIFIYVWDKIINACIVIFLKNRVIAIGYYRPVMQCPIAFLFIVVWSWIRLLVTPPQCIIVSLGSCCICFALLCCSWQCWGRGGGLLISTGHPVLLEVSLPPLSRSHSLPTTPPLLGVTSSHLPGEPLSLKGTAAAAARWRIHFYLFLLPLLSLCLSLTAGLIFWR